CGYVNNRISVETLGEYNHHKQTAEKPLHSTDLSRSEAAPIARPGTDACFSEKNRQDIRELPDSRVAP
ncbi:MAG: hypothetical protein ACXWBM_11400, partial [Chthoniobacterales bacterium]